MTRARALVATWKARSDSDLLTCERLLSFEEPTADTILFHAQQAVEKALKGYLIDKQIEFPKTHDLRYLLQLARKHDDAFTSLKDIASMNAYAIETRYPESMEWIDEVDVAGVVQRAREVCEWIWPRVEGI